MKYILLIVFINAAGDPVIPDGWHPIMVANKETCEIRKQFMAEYVADNVDRSKLVDFKITCIPSQ